MTRSRRVGPVEHLGTTIFGFVRATGGIIVMGFQALWVACPPPHRIRSLIRQRDNIGVGSFVSIAISPVLTALLATGRVGSEIGLRLGRCA